MPRNGTARGICHRDRARPLTSCLLNSCELQSQEVVLIVLYKCLFRYNDTVVLRNTVCNSQTKTVLCVQMEDKFLLDELRGTLCENYAS
jgi:hypothetical protein